MEGSLKPVLLALVVWALASTSFAQGLVTFANGPTTLISYGPASSESPLTANEAGGFYFGLLISTNPAAPFTFTGVYATNTATAGRIGPGSYTVAVASWPPCTSLFYEIAGWSSNLGPVWNPGWLVNNLPAPGDDPVWSGAPTNSYFGLSGIAEGAASGQFCDPALPLFGGSGLQGFNLAPVVQQVNLSASISGGNIVLSWTPSGGTLQSSPTVGPGGTWSAVGTQNPTNLPIAGAATFFRVGGGPYSTNIVGFATVTVPPGYSLLANPLDAGATNGANEIMPILNGEIILTWYGKVMYDSTAGGWVTLDGATPAQPPSLPPGEGFFFYNPNPTPTNFTFVGQVVPGPSSTHCMNSEPGYNLIGSPLPATVDTITNVPVQFPIIDGMIIVEWIGGRYVQTMYDSTAGGWVQIDDTTPSVAPPYSIGQGFFLFNPSTVPLIWCQSLALSTLPTFFTQGQVQFANNPSTLISYGPPGNEALLPANDAGGVLLCALDLIQRHGPVCLYGHIRHQ
jgi:hypothetical protein